MHGSYHHTSEFIFKSTPWSIKHQNFEDMGVDIILSGHCGLPFHHVNRNNYWLNPGVIGMPANDGTQRVWYMTLEENKDSVLFHHHSFEYDASMASSLMNEYRLPEAYAKTLINGIWDNCEILPQKETHNQGIRIEF